MSRRICHIDQRPQTGKVFTVGARLNQLSSKPVLVLPLSVGLEEPNAKDSNRWLIYRNLCVYDLFVSSLFVRASSTSSMISASMIWIEGKEKF